jgi:3D (Asp-Asp-Asp) domain-containing protein
MTRRALPALTGLILSCLLLLACNSSRKWVNAPLQASSRDRGVRLLKEAPPSERDTANIPQQPSGSIDPAPGPLDEKELADAQGKRPELKLQGEKQKLKEGPVDGRLLGVFRNTYYDFPAEADFTGPRTKLMARSCKPISEVPRGFYEAVCVQGSGTLVSGKTVSFAKRDCACAEVCPRTGQKICFDELDQREFPWGRGAQGTAITPLRSIAVDSSVIPLGTIVYILEYDGVPRSEGGARHDGCFIAEDRGMKVVGDHVDIFTGNPRVTQHLNQRVPSNQGVHVYVDTARCAVLSGG